MAGRGWDRLGAARRIWIGSDGQGLAGQGKADEARRGKARHGGARRGKADKALKCNVSLSIDDGWLLNTKH